MEGNSRIFKFKYQGFTLIELVVVLLLIAILSVTVFPQFLNFSDDAEASIVDSTGAALGTGVSLAHSKWLTQGFNGSASDLDLYGDGSVLMDFNNNGWPVQVQNSVDDNPTLDNRAECIQVWEGLLSQDSPSVSTSTDADFRIKVLGTVRDECVFEFSNNTNYTITYDPESGDVTTQTTVD